jgi:hypothetical protein
MFVSDTNLDEMTAQVRQFNTIRAELGLPPDQPTTRYRDMAYLLLFCLSRSCPCYTTGTAL